MVEPIEVPFGLWTQEGSRKHVLHGAQIPHTNGQLLGERACRGHARRHSAVSSTKTAEPIDLPFWLWTRAGQCSTSSIAFALMGGHVGAIW